MGILQWQKCAAHAEVTQQICVPTDGRKNILGMQFYFENKELLLQWYLKMFCIIWIVRIYALGSACSAKPWCQQPVAIKQQGLTVFSTTEEG